MITYRKLIVGSSVVCVSALVAAIVLLGIRSKLTAVAFHLVLLSCNTAFGVGWLSEYERRSRLERLTPTGFRALGESHALAGYRRPQLLQENYLRGFSDIKTGYLERQIMEKNLEIAKLGSDVAAAKAEAAWNKLRYSPKQTLRKQGVK